MAAFCHVWGMTPTDYWALTVAEHRALSNYANELRKERDLHALTGTARTRRGFDG